ncbi:MAG: 50S ribosomal protein L3 [Candidatus Pacearchaeota archaeon]|nr:MAG: 50S ribosomal protein L3 [Candidatus Pacearchaeota archaeon]
MPTKRSPRKGSLQFWPRKRASRILPRVNWNAISSDSVKNLKGFIAYKAGMFSAIVKDMTENSMTKGKKISFSVSVLECPPMKIFSVRFYKNGKVVKEFILQKPEKELKRKLKIPKKANYDTNFLNNLDLKDFDDVRVLCYSIVKKTNIKKTPDLKEIALSGNLEKKIEFIKSKLDKEISVFDVFEKGQLVDLRGLTKGKGFSGAVKRFGISLKQHKTEKGVRRPGSLGPWHPARVSFRVAMAGQLGFFTRVIYNSKIIDIGSSKEIPEKLKNIKNFGEIKNDYIIVKGSVQGPAKRQILITHPLRPSKKQLKKRYELLEIE